jgi:hypothetical protein
MAKSNSERQKAHREKWQRYVTETQRYVTGITTMLLEIKEELASLRNEMARRYVTPPSLMVPPNEYISNPPPLSSQSDSSESSSYDAGAREVWEHESTKPEASNGRAKPRRRISPDWQPSERDCEFALECGLDPDTTAEEFRDYWLGCGQPHADWSATFRNRCRTLTAEPRVNGFRHRKSPVEKLYAGAYRAALAFDARQRDRGEADEPLLDC